MCTPRRLSVKLQRGYRIFSSCLRTSYWNKVLHWIPVILYRYSLLLVCKIRMQKRDQKKINIKTFVFWPGRSVLRTEGYSWTERCLWNFRLGNEQNVPGPVSCVSGQENKYNVGQKSPSSGSGMRYAGPGEAVKQYGMDPIMCRTVFLCTALREFSPCDLLQSVGRLAPLWRCSCRHPGLRTGQSWRRARGDPGF